MRSPFPGVDPFIEDQHYWADFHPTFLNSWREAILEQLPAGYDARFDENVYLSNPAAEEWHRNRQPDIAIVETDVKRATVASPAGTALVETATLRHLEIDPVTEVYIRIIHRESQALVSVLELLSPTNKQGEGRGQYLTKRRELRHGGVNLVELDLLIAGNRLPHQRPLPMAHYYVLLTRQQAPDYCQIFAWNLPQAIPSIPIPLLPGDGDLICDLASVYATTYERGHYERAIRYDQALALPLEESTLSWVNAQTQPKPLAAVEPKVQP